MLLNISCPFCGDFNSLNDILQQSKGEFHVLCLSCGSAGPYGNTEIEAIELYVNRVVVKEEDKDKDK